MLVDGHPVQEYPLKGLRDSIAMVLQKNTLFSGTVEENLRWGKEDATREEINTACRIACVDEFIDRLENGYQTEMGQGGVNVSGGQRKTVIRRRWDREASTSRAGRSSGSASPGQSSKGPRY